MFLNFSAFMELEAPSPAVFGMTTSRLDLGDVVQRIVSRTGYVRPGASVLAVADMQHVALMRNDPELRGAMQTADLVTCAGLPLMRYARFLGCVLPGSITGLDIADALLEPALLASHRAYFVLPCEKTAAAMRGWALTCGVRAEVEVVPASLADDRSACASLAARVAAFGATILFLGIDAPHAELFAVRHRNDLPDGCWALCIGDVFGLVSATSIAMPSPSRFPRLSLRDVGRSVGRYFSDTLNFALSVYQDLTTPPTIDVQTMRHTRIV